MASARETAVAALAALLQQTGAKVSRGTDIPETIPPAGLITVAEGDSAEEAVMSPLRWLVDLACDVQVQIVAADEPTRDAALDALLRQIGTLIAADRTLGGAVDWAEPQHPSFIPAEVDGAAKAAHFAIVLSFTAADTTLS